LSYKYPPNWQLKKILRQKCTVIKVQVNIIDDQYGQATETPSSYIVDDVEIQPITSEDLQFLPPGTLDVGDARGFFKELLGIKICLADFCTASDYTYDPTKIIVENCVAKLKAGIDPCFPYAVDNPTIRKTICCAFTIPPFSIEIKETKPAKTEIKYIISGDGGTTWYYWDSSWKLSDGTYAKASISSIIIANFATFPKTSGTFCFKAFLHSDDGTATPILDDIKATFGIKLSTDDYIIDHQNIKYRVERITDYYTDKAVLMKEIYLKRVVGV